MPRVWLLRGRQDANGFKISGWQDPNGLMVKWRARCNVFDIWGIEWGILKCMLLERRTAQRKARKMQLLGRIQARCNFLNKKHNKNR